MMKHWRGLVALAVVTVLCLLSVSFIVWLPDVLTGKTKVVATCPLPDGGSVSVTQFWNGYDFYTTRFVHVEEESRWSFVLDGDAEKWWFCSLQVNSEKVEIRHFGRKLATYNRKAHTYTRGTQPSDEYAMDAETTPSL